MSDAQSEIEAIARATYEAYGGRFGAWDLLPEWSRKERRKYAEAIHDAVAPAIAERGREELLKDLIHRIESDRVGPEVAAAVNSLDDDAQEWEGRPCGYPDPHPPHEFINIPAHDKRLACPGIEEPT